MHPRSTRRDAAPGAGAANRRPIKGMPQHGTGMHPPRDLSAAFRKGGGIFSTCPAFVDIMSRYSGVSGQGCHEHGNLLIGNNHIIMVGKTNPLLYGTLLPRGGLTGNRP